MPFISHDLSVGAIIADESDGDTGVAAWKKERRTNLHRTHQALLFRDTPRQTRTIAAKRIKLTGELPARFTPAALTPARRRAWPRTSVAAGSWRLTALFSLLIR